MRDVRYPDYAQSLVRKARLQTHCLSIASEIIIWPPSCHSQRMRRHVDNVNLVDIFPRRGEFLDWWTPAYHGQGPSNLIREILHGTWSIQTEFRDFPEALLSILVNIPLGWPNVLHVPVIVIMQITPADSNTCNYSGLYIQAVAHLKLSCFLKSPAICQLKRSWLISSWEFESSPTGYRLGHFWSLSEKDLSLTESVPYQTSLCYPSQCSSLQYTKRWYWQKPRLPYKRL